MASHLKSKKVLSVERRHLSNLEDADWRALLEKALRAKEGDLTLCLVFLAIVALLAVVIAPVVLAFVPLAGSTAWLLEFLRWIIALGVLLLALGLLYRFGPARPGPRGRWFTVGAVVVIVLWILASAGLSFYLTNFGAYNEVYGSIGAVIGLMLWLYVSAYLILLGAALNAHIHRNSAVALDS